MIKFFRNIRKKLLAEGKTANYLKYAIGEIVLVVIGILIALQVNNWNEVRKEKRQLNLVLTNLSHELQQNSNYFEDVYNAEKNIFLHSAELLFNAHSKDDITQAYDSILGRSFRFACFTPNIKSTRNAYQELMRSDLLNHVSSNILKEQLKEYYSQIDFLQNYTEQAYQISNDLIADLSEYYTIIPDTSQSRKISDFAGAAEDYFSTQYDLLSFREDKSLNPKLYDMIDIHKDRLGGLEILRNLSNNIQQEIDNELSNH